MLNDFKDKAALITGAASGIGRACALALAEAGANVVIIDKANEEMMIQLARTIKEFGVRVSTFTADVTDHGKAGRIINETRSRLGRLDILVNAAGLHSDALLNDLDEAAWERSLNVNLKGAFNYLQAAARVFRGQQSGKVVNVTPVQVVRGRYSLTNTTVAKAGVAALTQTAAAELGRVNVNVNAVAPGFIELSSFAKLPAPVREQALREAALGRVGTPEDVARVVLFLCSEAARHITGEIIRVDGGQTL